MAREKEEKPDVLYVGVQNPIEIRRTILEATKDVVEILQKYERFRAVREEKIKTVNSLREQVKEITKLVAKLKSELPKVDVRVRLHKEQEMVEAERKAAKQAGKPKKKAPAPKKEAAPP
ncbi:hypothetical protein KY345_02810, partial [Candidatus Woesearchaeota archaeon]|nr:hypothetical protein [Candidatus Woesearchaeota archaeon]